MIKKRMKNDKEKKRFLKIKTKQKKMIKKKQEF